MSSLSLLALAPLPRAVGQEREQERERFSLNADWRFHKGDAPGESAVLMYDVRPTVTEKQDTKSADAQPEAATKATTQAARAVLKPWILPSGNRLIKDPARRFVRPSIDPPGEVPTYAQPKFDDRAWERVTLPHDWAIAGPFNQGGGGVGGGMGRLPSPGVGWYRRKLDIADTDAGKSIFLDIDGAMSHACVWVNGKLVGGWPYGYASWRVDLTQYVVPGGENELAIRLDNPPDSSRWYPGGGIYRNVWLVKNQPIHVGHWGTYLTSSDVSTASATIALEVTIDNDSPADATAVEVSTEIFALDEDGKPTGDAVARIDPVTTAIASRASATVRGSVLLSKPRLWGPPPEQHPYRYVAVTSIRKQDKLLDTCETHFGVRSLRFDAENGLLINGQRIASHGVNLHHDLGPLGAAFNARAAQRQLETLREMGCNAIRTAHNPPAPELLELADRMGFLVLDEIFDSWERRKTPLDFHLIFPEWHEQDLRAMLRRDRNHPSIIVWSVGNEVGEQYTGSDGAAIASRLCAIVKEEDPTRPATSAMNFAKSDMRFPAGLDVISLNYQGEGIRDTAAHAGMKGIRTPPQYDAFHEKFPGKMILSSESAAAVSTRGEYLFPVFEGISAPVRDQMGGDSKRGVVSAYELHAMDFGSSPDKVFAALDRHPFVAGEFVWSGWDYLGEPTPYYSSRSSYCGIIDLAGFRKDRFYLYQSRWRPELPMAHILPHWNWPERVGKITPVHVFTSGDAAELFLNGKSLGRKKKEAFQYRLRWDDVLYEPGELKVIAYKDGREWAKEIMRTADDPTRLAASADRTEIRCDGLDLAFVTVRITDAHGVTHPRANDPIRFTLDGPGEIVATDNGDPTCFEPFPSPHRNAFNGLCLAIVRGEAGTPGTITLRAESPSLQGTTLVLRSVQGD